MGGFLKAKSKASLIASTIIAVILMVLAQEEKVITPWPAAVLCLCLVYMFGKKSFAKESSSACPVHNDDLTAMPDDQEKQNDPLTKYTRVQDPGESKKKTSPLFLILAGVAFVLALLYVQLAL